MAKAAPAAEAAEETTQSIENPTPEESIQSETPDAAEQTPSPTEESVPSTPDSVPQTPEPPDIPDEPVLSTEHSVPESPITPPVEATASPPTPPEPPAEAPPPSKLLEKASQADAGALAVELAIGELLCRDILGALKRPGRDPREDLPPPVFRREILKFEDLKQGMQLAGTVLNVVDFGAFVDIGLHDTGLVHISRLADRYIKDPHEVVGVGDTLTVWVMGVDKQRRRVQLTAIQPGTEKPPRPRRSERRPPRRDAQDKDKRPSGDKSKDRRPRRKPDRQGGGRSRRDERPQRSGPFELTSKKEKKAKLTKAMKEGRAPLRTFGDLKQFIDLKEEPQETPKEKPAVEPAQAKAQSPPTDDTQVVESQQADEPAGSEDAATQSAVDTDTDAKTESSQASQEQTASSQANAESS